MYNLHCHSLLSDGCLLPSEIAVRYAAAGYRTIAITDHVDYSNIELVSRAIVTFVKYWSPKGLINVLPGVEITHVPPEQFLPLVRIARKLGIKIIVGHGETPVEPVLKGTNRAAIEAGVDILAHPGFITAEEVSLAVNQGVFLEITTRAGHRNGNAHVLKSALAAQAKIILNTDSHDPQDIITPAQVLAAHAQLGLSSIQVAKINQDVEELLRQRI